MPSVEKHILAAGGDVGGCRALLPGLIEAARQGVRVEVLDSGALTVEAPSSWRRCPYSEAEKALRDRISMPSLYTFSTSLRDVIPLRLARLAQTAGVPTLAVLDNWMNYRNRLEIDGNEFFQPDVYAVMDDFARDKAIAEGVPASILRVTGHPALAGLKERYESFDRASARRRLGGRWGVDTDGRRLIVFVSEPASLDQGQDASSPLFRGYTELTVLNLLAHSLQPFAEQVVFMLAPHPREDDATLRNCWEACRGRLAGGVLNRDTGREAVFAADGVCGMASLLLYEALLLGKPVLSVQPGLRLQDLMFLKQKGVDEFVSETAALPMSVSRWMNNLLAGNVRDYHKELELHTHAPEALAAEMIQLGKLKEAL